MLCWDMYLVEKVHADADYLLRQSLSYGEADYLLRQSLSYGDAFGNHILSVSS